MKRKIISVLERLDLLYWSSGAYELIRIGSKVATFLICFMGTSLLTMGGMVKFSELWGNNHPYVIVLCGVAAYVTLVGAITVAREGVFLK